MHLRHSKGGLAWCSLWRVRRRGVSPGSQGLRLGAFVNTGWFREEEARFGGKGGILFCSVGNAAGPSCGESQVSLRIWSSETTSRLEMHM